MQYRDISSACAVSESYGDKNPGQGFKYHALDNGILEISDLRSELVVAGSWIGILRANCSAGDWTAKHTSSVINWTAKKGEHEMIKEKKSSKPNTNLGNVSPSLSFERHIGFTKAITLVDPLY
jgi:hypothetical protein